jgi:transposase
VLDREFSYLELLQYLVQSQVNFVIRLNLASHPTFYDASGRKVTLTVSLGAQAVYCNLRYLNQVTVNVVGVWRKGCAEPLWVMSNLAPERALAIYAARMKIEEALRDLKNLLQLDKLMNQSQAHMEQMAALVMLAFSIGLLTGETLRDALFGAPASTQPDPNAPQAVTETAQSKLRRKWDRYSGLFILLKLKLDLKAQRLRELHAQAVATFAHIIQPPPVRT